MLMTDGLTLKILLAAPRWLRNYFVGAGKKKRKKVNIQVRCFPGFGRCFGIDQVPSERPCRYETDVEQILCGDSGVAGVSVGR